MSTHVIVALAGVAVVAGAFFYGQSVGAAGERAAQKDRETLVREVAEASQAAAAVEIGKIEAKNVTQRQVLQREIVERPVYRDCRHSPDGLRAVNNALVPSSADPGPVSAPDSAR